MVGTESPPLSPRLTLHHLSQPYGGCLPPGDTVNLGSLGALVVLLAAWVKQPSHCLRHLKKSAEKWNSSLFWTAGREVQLATGVLNLSAPQPQNVGRLGNAAQTFGAQARLIGRHQYLLPGESTGCTATPGSQQPGVLRASHEGLGRSLRKFGFSRLPRFRRRAAIARTRSADDAVPSVRKRVGAAQLLTCRYLNDTMLPRRGRPWLPWRSPHGLFHHSTIQHFGSSPSPSQDRGLLELPFSSQYPLPRRR